MAKLKKKLGRVLKAGLTAYAASKLMKPSLKGRADLLTEGDISSKADYMHDLESVPSKKIPLKGHPGGWNEESGTFSSPPMNWKRKTKLWWEKLTNPNPYKKAGGTIKAYQGQLVKSETRGTGAAVQGTTHEVMPGMDAAKHGKLIKARHGTQVRTRGSNPDSSWTTQGGEVKVATKLNGVLTTRTW